LDWRVYPDPYSDSMLEQTASQFSRALVTLRTEVLWKKIKELPDEWVNFPALREFALCLDRLTNPKLLRDIHTVIVDSVRALNREHEHACKPPLNVMTMAAPHERALRSLIPRALA
jgi:hypothetical protein